MTELTAIRWRTLLWFFLFPATFLGWVPWWLHRQFEGPFGWEGALLQWLGIWLIANGAGLAGWCVQLFNVQGRGTPLPLDPPTRFVASGPYRFVRNPMALGLLLLLGGQAALYGSRAVLLYLLVILTAVHPFVVLVEEPELTKRFGPSYEAYRKRVPRWIPRPPV